MSWLWSWLLTGVGVTGLYFAGRRQAVGWMIGLGAQVLWLAYAITTRQWGFLASCACYGTVHARNFVQWRRPGTAVIESRRRDRPAGQATQRQGDAPTTGAEPG